MARTITRADMVYASFPIEKQSTDPDTGDLIIYGKATDGTIDADRQIVDPAWSGPALEKWLATRGNIRVQHSPHLYPAGKGVSVEVDRDGDGGHWVKARIVEDTAKKLVKAGVLQDFSVGIAHPLILRDTTGKAIGGIVTGNADTEIAELSIVDRGSNHNSGFTLAKSANFDAPWTLGDVDAMLAKVESAQTKKAKKKPPASAPDSANGDGDGDDGDILEDDPGTDAHAEDDEAPDAEDDEATADLTKTTDPYQAARAQWLAREPTLAGAPLAGTEFLAKRAAWTRWHANGEADGLDGTADGRARWLAKRNMDPNVGGGVDRSKIPASDHVDPQGRRFPIVEPGDVSDAVSSYGRADPKIPMKRFKKRLTSIANRKGSDFAAQLPASWSGKSITMTAPNATGLVPYNLQGQQQPSAEKGVKDCPKCGATYHADSKLRNCESCGAKLPKANKRKDPDVSKTAPMPPDVKPAGKHREPDGSVEELEADAGMPTDHDKDDTEHVPASVKAKKKGKGKPFPGAAKPFGAAADAADGDDDASGDDGDDTAEKSVTPYVVRRMHDALCAAYPWDAVHVEYPSLGGVADAITPLWFRDQVTVASRKSDMRAVTVLASRAQDADALAKGAVEPEKLADARAWLHKAFTDMYPAEHLTPGAPPSPGQFQRPYISAGHAPMNAPPSRTPNIPPATHVPDPNDFTRPYITAGHQTDSPANKGDNLDTGGDVSSGASRQYYTNASKEAARQAMQAMHDHIAATFPDMCPMAASKSVMPPDMGDTNRPVPVHPAPTRPAPGEVSTKTVEPALSKRQVTKLVKSAVRTQARRLETTYRNQIARLEAEIDELGAAPDPAQAPLRGVVRKAATTEPTPVAKRSLVEEAQARAAREQEDYVAHLQRLEKSSNPATREQARNLLEELLVKAT